MLAHSEGVRLALPHLRHAAAAAPALGPLLQPALEALQAAAAVAAAEARCESDPPPHPKHAALRQLLVAASTLHPGARLLLLADQPR